MESKQGSLNKLIRIHLKTQRKASQQRKLAKNAINPIIFVAKKNTLQYPQPSLNYSKQKSQKALNMLSLGPRSNLPTLKTTNFDHYQSSKMLLETGSKVKSSSEFTDIFSPRQIVNKLKRIKSEQSMLTNERSEVMRKQSAKCKVYVHNPFHRKQSRNPDCLQSSKIMKNESKLSQNGCHQIEQIISFL